MDGVAVPDDGEDTLSQIQLKRIGMIICGQYLILHVHQLFCLENSEKILSMLQNKHLKAILLEIDSSSTPQKLLNKALLLPVFKEFIDNCLHIVEDEASS